MQANPTNYGDVRLFSFQTTYIARYLIASELNMEI